MILKIRGRVRRERTLPNRAILVGVVWVLLWSLNGCSLIGPDFRRPEIAMRENWLAQNKKDLKRGDYREWWKVFSDPVLNDLIAKAYQQNLNLQAAAVRIMEARAQLGIARGNFFPQTQTIGGEFGYTKLSERSPNFVSTYDPEYFGFQAGFDAIWEVDIWGRFRRGIESANAKLGVSLADYEDVLVSLTAEVAASYVQIREFQQRLKVAKSNRRIQHESLHITEVSLTEGIGNELDVQQAKALLYNTRALIAGLEIGLRQSKNALAVLLGRFPQDLDQGLKVSQAVPAVEERIAIGIPNELLRRRPDIRRAEFQAAAQSALIGVAKADLLPRFSLRGSLGLNTSNTGAIDVFDVFDIKSLAAAFGPSVTWPILNYGRLKNNVRVQDARLEQALIGYKQTVLQAVREVEDALIAFRKARSQVDDLRKGVAASNRAVELSLIQYREGIEDYTRILNSQQFLVEQQDRLIQSQSRVAKNVIALYKAIGGGWEIREGKDLIPTEIKQRMEERTDWDEMLAEQEADG